MLALAVMAAAGTALARLSPRLLPRWLGYAGALFAAALAVSGAGYLLLSSALAAAAYASLPLLILWVGPR